jgi:hypothetical protein
MTSRQPVSSHNRSNASAGPMRRAGGDRIDDNGFGGKARARTQQALQLPALAQILDASERCDDLLAHGLAFATAFDDLEIGAAAGGFLAEIHGGGPGATQTGCAHDPARCLQSQHNSVKTWHYIFARLPARANNINDLQSGWRLPLLKISSAVGRYSRRRARSLPRADSRGLAGSLKNGGRSRYCGCRRVIAMARAAHRCQAAMGGSHAADARNSRNGAAVSRR